MVESEHSNDTTNFQVKDIRSKLLANLVENLKSNLKKDNILDTSNISSICKLVESENVPTNDVIKILEKYEDNKNGN